MADQALSRICIVDNCANPHHAREYCRMHYLRLWRNGTTDKIKTKKTCSIEGCGKIARGQGWCAMHYKRWSKYGDPLTVKRAVSAPYAGIACEHCSRPAKKRGLCGAHYRRWLSHGDPLIAKRVGNRVLHDWILAHVSHEGNECLIWPFWRDKNGYGHLTFDGERHTANYFMCMYAHGKPPSSEHESAHSCGNGYIGCVNPNHLYWATRQENMDDMARHGTRMQGARHYLTKLTEVDVLEIRKLAASGMRQEDIGKLFSVSSGVVNSIHVRRTWKWLE